MSMLETPQHARIQEFSSGGGGGSDNVLRFFFYLSFFKVPERVQHFSMGGPTFSRGGGGGPIAYSL